MLGNLEVLSALPSSRRANEFPPVLFVHGAYCDAWCWEVYVLPWFASRGYAAYALSLRGHGNSPGRESLDTTKLADYVDDIRDVAAGLPKRPLLVGHSMGAALVERLIAEEDFPGAALVCPIPPTGLLPVLTRLLFGRPEFLWQAQKLHQGMFDQVSLSTLREFYFTTNVSPALLVEALHHLSPESSRAVSELAWRGHLQRANSDAMPVCVMAGEKDALFTVDDAEATARRHEAELVVLEGLPHMLMLEPGWERLAQALDAWIRTSVPVPDAAFARRAAD